MPFQPRLPLLALFIAASVTAVPPRASAAGALARGLELIDQAYLFESQLKPPVLLDKALERIERLVPALASSKAGDRAFVLEAPPCRMRVELPPEASSVVDLKKPLERVAAFVERCTGEPLSKKSPTASVLLRAVLSGLDPYSTVFDPERRSEHTIQFRGQLAGIGARIGIRNDRLTLVKVYPGAPGHRAGLRDGDVVRRIDGVSTTGMSVTEAVHRIRGEVGTPVRLTIERKGAPELLDFVVVRGIVTIPSVEAESLPGGIIYAKITHFSQTTPEDFRGHVERLYRAGNSAGVIIDLRQNSGGSMLGSASIGDLFLSEGLLITTAGRRGARVPGLTGEIRATSDTPFANLPVVILTSPHTASGSELLAGSLRNNDRAVLAGERTYGKGTVQKTYGLSNGSALKITVGNFLPKGLAIPGGGMNPDIEVDRYVIAPGRVRLPASHVQLDLPFWLQTPSWLKAADRRPVIAIPSVEELNAGEEGAAGDHTTKPANDPLVELAAELLRRAGSTSATEMLSRARNWLDARKQLAEREVASVFARHGVDWSAPQGSAGTHASLERLEVSLAVAEGALAAGETGRVTVTVRNRGTDPIYRLRGKIVGKGSVLSGHGLLFGLVPPGAAKTWELEATPSRTSRTSRQLVRVELYDDAGLVGIAGPFPVVVRETPRPHLAFRWRVSPQEGGTMGIRIEVNNRGNAPAEEVRVALRHPETNEAELVRGSETFELIGPGETKVAELKARLLLSPAEPPALDLTVSEPKFGTFETAKIPLLPAGAASEWRDPPRIEVAGYREGEGASRIVVFRVRDDRGLEWVLSRVDGDQIGFQRMLPGTTQAEMEVPWLADPAKTTRILLRARDRTGQEAIYRAEL
ncbi:MAG: PDZ domain-containing protein [Candidatus Dadabacteria bacterium]|nr:MAG: PDZ domain-containing protein [Candidatus Dadabacteria bacterium]